MYIKGLRDAVKVYNCWPKSATIFFDTQTGELWTDIFEEQGTRRRYFDRAIVPVVSKRYVEESSPCKVELIDGIKLLKICRRVLRKESKAGVDERFRISSMLGPGV